MNHIAIIIVRRSLLLVLAAMVWVGIAVAQDTAGSSDSGAVPAATAPAEQNNAENPPLSGLDQPVAEPAFGGRSYLMPGVQVSESADSNAAASSKKTHTAEITRALVSADLQKIWRKYQFGLDYVAGGDFYAGPLFVKGQGRATQEHSLAAVQRMLWRTGQLAIRDSFDYLPEGSFGFNSYGGAASFGSSLGNGVSGAGAGTGLGGGLGGGSIGSVSYGSVAYQPRIDNSAVVDIVQGLSPRSTVTLAGGYSFSHYLDLSSQQFAVINSQETSGQIGYNHLLSRRDQIGVDYGFQEIHFPLAGSGSVTAHVWHALYGHRVTGKLNLTLAGGPQYVIVNNPPTVLPTTPPIVIAVPATKAIAANGSAMFSYTVSSRSNVQLAYQRYVTPGSGLFAGANTDAVRFSVGHLFGRHWTTTTDTGYSHNSNLQKANSSSTSGVHSHSYQFWYAGTSLQRQLGQHFSAFVSYQFNDMGIGSCSGTGTSGVCGVTTTRHTGQIGINWHPRPIRLD